jgi:hypothetical protein
MISTGFAVRDRSPGLPGTGFAAQGDGLAFGLAQQGASPGIIARENEESRKEKRDARDDGKDTTGDPRTEEDPSAYHSYPSVACCGSLAHAD